MIHPNELLKVGNWVNGTSTQGYTQPVKVTLELLPIILSGTAIITYSGIPITKELLVEKCGFTTNDRDVTSIGISDTASLVYFEGRFQIVTISKSATSLYHIKYLHQLQTLIFSLCGEELKINIH